MLCCKSHIAEVVKVYSIIILLLINLLSPLLFNHNYSFRLIKNGNQDQIIRSNYSDGRIEFTYTKQEIKVLQLFVPDIEKQKYKFYLKNNLDDNTLSLLTYNKEKKEFYSQKDFRENLSPRSPPFNLSYLFKISQN